MTETLKRYYLKALINLFFDKAREGQEPTRLGRALLPRLPHPQIRWQSGYQVVPHYGNRRWLKKSFQGAHEPALETFILEVVPPGSIAVDVGAQVGMVTVLLGKRVGPAGRVISFEPNPYNYGILQEVIRANDLTNITTVHRAIGSRNATLSFQKTTQAGYRMVPQGTATRPGDAVRQVEVIRLDGFCQSQGLSRVNFIKIDVDGPDFDALLGAEGLLRSAHKPLLSVEMSHYWTEFGHSFDEAFAYLTDCGYGVFIAPRKTNQLSRLADPATLPEGWGTLPKQAFNFYGLHLEAHQPLIDLATRLVGN